MIYNMQKLNANIQVPPYICKFFLYLTFLKLF